jgi:hypothetical protein
MGSIRRTVRRTVNVIIALAALGCGGFVYFYFRGAAVGVANRPKVGVAIPARASQFGTIMVSMPPPSVQPVFVAE